MNVEVNVGYTWEGFRSTYNHNLLTGDDGNTGRQIDNFRFANGNTFTPQRWANSIGASGGGSYHLPQNFFSTDVDGPGGLDDLDGDGFYDDLPPSGTTQISFDFTVDNVNSTCGLYSNFYNANLRLLVENWGSNSCGDALDTESIPYNEFGIRREAFFNSATPELYDQNAESGEVSILISVAI